MLISLALSSIDYCSLLQDHMLLPGLGIGITHAIACGLLRLVIHLCSTSGS